MGEVVEIPNQAAEGTGFDLFDLVQKAKGDLAEIETREAKAEESGVRNSNETEEGEREESEFFGQRVPAHVLQEEKPQHRVICYLAAEGNTAKEIAEKTGFTPTMVSYVLKQPWASKRVAEIIAQHGGDQVQTALKGAALDCAQLLIGVVKDKEVDIRVRSGVARDLLDRVYGKAITTTMNLSPEDLTDAELAKHLGNGRAQTN